MLMAVEPTCTRRACTLAPLPGLPGAMRRKRGDGGRTEELKAAVVEADEGVWWQPS